MKLREVILASRRQRGTVAAADVRTWDRQRGEPPLPGGFTIEQEQAVLAEHDRDQAR
jgi:hypothetical protein